ncbi:hypothetical protein THAOC_28824 [Thalassiosira oceanica]|uniref:Uncharacterized protein n=1 Tax=Thalassiosira oceanica TaxID=159749 RepID=K0RFC2_THAOC|nr:hypothetical protein THAOC_28824 [Thalassiosira oceanica]|eukprot:EJK51955.1 hypothetical protein THAOC_28824 [Thalassiosira oceanica]
MALVAVLRVITEAQSHILGIGSEIPYSSLCVATGYSSKFTQLEAGGKRKPAPVDSDSEVDEEAETPRPRSGRKKKRANPPAVCKNKHNQLASMRLALDQGVAKVIRGACGTNQVVPLSY